MKIRIWACTSLFLLAAAAQDPVFEAPIVLTTGRNPYQVVTADLDKDGDADLAVAAGTATFVMMGNGDGTYGARVEYATGAYVGEINSIDITLGDFDQDTWTDLAVADFVHNRTFVLRNNRNGTFAPPVFWPTHPSPYAVTAADLNGDRYPDLAFACSGNALSILMNNRNGTFAAPVNYVTSPSPTANPLSVHAGDFDRDGDLDVVVGNGNTGTLAYFRNLGAGTFAARVEIPNRSEPFAVASADLDGDGDLDLVTANEGMNSMSVLKNNGNGTFAPQVIYPTQVFPNAIAIADLDADGKLDVTIANWYSSSVSCFPNAGDGTFPRRLDFPTGYIPVSVVALDDDRDGDKDLITANNPGMQGLPSPGTVTRLRNVTSRVLQSITVRPGFQPVPRGFSRTFSASGWDQFGQPYPVSGVVWSASGGTIDANGRFTGPVTGGTFTITARVGTLSATATARVAPVTLRGDMNSDGVLTASDIVLLQNFVFLGTNVPAYVENADMNGDLAYSSSDVVLMLNAVFLGDPTLPVVGGGTPIP